MLAEPFRPFAWPRNGGRCARAYLVAGIFCVAACLFASPSVRADSWRARLWDEGLPESLVAVDKKNKTFHFLEKKSPLRLRYSFPCVTGQLEGDKQQVNDLKTPEGIYFVEYKIANGLDFGEYGGIAYTLNYPNPVDRLRGKTGHGIWIHSKGYGLVPTRGCVAIGLREIAEVGPSLSPGTAVLLAHEFDAKSGPTRDKGTARQLRKLMQDWSNAWAQRSSGMFDFYDSHAYSLATENFALFRQNKERLFKILRFIKIFNREIHVLEGPGYWVTWAEQFYTASNLSTEGVRRLYWQPGNDGRFRIVGMEWTPRDIGMAAEFRKGRLIAQAPIQVSSDASSEAPRQPPLDMPERGEQNNGLPENASPPVPASVLAAMTSQVSPENDESQKTLRPALLADPAALLAFMEPLIPRRRPEEPPAEFNWDKGQTLQRDKKSISEEDIKTVPAMESQTDDAVGPDFVSSVRNAALAWSRLLGSRSADIFSFYDKSGYNRVPGVAKGPSLSRTRAELEKLISSPWLVLIDREPHITVNGDVCQSSSEQLLASPKGIMQGKRILYWRMSDTGEPKIVSSDFRLGDFGLGAEYLEQISLSVSRDIEAWRRAWELADINGYMSFYAPNAVQQSRAGSKNIRFQKEGLWSRVKPSTVKLAGIRLALDGGKIRADMTQSYADSAGRSDRGIKTLLMHFDGSRWLIDREDWSPAPGSR